jgi:hypothetical protein
MQNVGMKHDKKLNRADLNLSSGNLSVEPRDQCQSVGDRVLLLKDSKCQNGGRGVRHSDTRIHLSGQIACLSTNFWATSRPSILVPEVPLRLSRTQLARQQDHQTHLIIASGRIKSKGMKTETPKEM